MQVQNFNYTGVKVQNPSFSAIHPAKYFIKDFNGTFVRVTDADTIKLLQRKVVGYLNKDANDNILKIQGKTPKPETAFTKTLRERFMNFFANNDKDYARRRMVCSFYDTRNKSAVPYIFTGDSAESITNLAKPIGQLKSELHSKLSTIRKQHGISTEEARRMLPKEEEALYNAQSNYYRTLYRTVCEEVKPSKPDNSYFNAYFEPVKIKRKTDYNLINAVFLKKMV